MYAKILVKADLNCLLKMWGITLTLIKLRFNCWIFMTSTSKALIVSYVYLELKSLIYSDT